MTSTYDQFVNRFRSQLREVAEFGGEEGATMEVIIDSLIQAGLKDLCDSVDALKAEGKAPVEVVAAKTTKTTKTTKTKKAAAAAAEKSATADKESGEEKATRGKRVTAYNIYFAEQVKEKKTTMKEAAASWKTMDDEAKAPYVSKAKANNSE